MGPAAGLVVLPAGHLASCSRRLFWAAPAGDLPGATVEATAPLPSSSFAAPGLPSLSLGPATHPPERVGTEAHPVRSPRLTPSTGARGFLTGSLWRRRRGGAQATPWPQRGRRRDSPPPLRPLPLPPSLGLRSAAQCSARRRVRHKQTQLGRTWTAEQLRLATDRRLRTPGLQTPGVAGKDRRAPQAQDWPGPLPPRSAPLPPHGSAAAAAAAAADAAFAFRGLSPQRVQALL